MKSGRPDLKHVPQQIRPDCLQAPKLIHVFLVFVLYMVFEPARNRRFGGSDLLQQSTISGRPKNHVLNTQMEVPGAVSESPRCCLRLFTRSRYSQAPSIHPPIPEKWATWPSSFFRMLAPTRVIARFGEARRLIVLSSSSSAKTNRTDMANSPLWLEAGT